MWNSLPDSVVLADTVNQFKNRLDKHWANYAFLLLLLLISSYDQYASSSFTSNNVMSVDKLQTVKSQKA